MYTISAALLAIVTAVTPVSAALTAPAVPTSGIITTTGVITDDDNGRLPEGEIVHQRPTGPSTTVDPRNPGGLDNPGDFNDGDPGQSEVEGLCQWFPEVCRR